MLVKGFLFLGATGCVCVHKGLCGSIEREKRSANFFERVCVCVVAFVPICRVTYVTQCVA